MTPQHFQKRILSTTEWSCKIRDSGNQRKHYTGNIQITEKILRILKLLTGGQNENEKIRVKITL